MGGYAPIIAIKGLKNNATRKSAATTKPVRPVRPPASTPAALSIKLVTVLVPSAAPATVPICIGDHRLFRARHFIVAHETSLLANADQCSYRIEREHEKKNRNKRQQRVSDIHFQDCRS